MRVSSPALLMCVILMTGLLTTACAPVLIGGAAAGAGATASSREGGVSQSFDDHRIELDLHDALFAYNAKLMGKLNIEVNQGKVLLTGIVQNAQDRVDAVRIAWQVKGVKQVINEIKVQGSEGLSGTARDKWIGTQLRSKLLFDSEISSLNYNTDVVGGVIYIMGVAQNQTELAKVMGIARSIKYVTNVVSYVQTRDQITNDQGRNTGGEIGSGAARSTVVSTNNGARATTVSNSNAGPTSAGNAASGYDYQPETRGHSMPVESSDLGPVR